MMMMTTTTIILTMMMTMIVMIMMMMKITTMMTMTMVLARIPIVRGSGDIKESDDKNSVERKRCTFKGNNTPFATVGHVTCFSRTH